MVLAKEQAMFPKRNKAMETQRDPLGLLCVSAVSALGPPLVHCQWLGLGIPGIQHSKSVPECHGPAQNVAPNSPKDAPDLAGKRTVS